MIKKKRVRIEYTYIEGAYGTEEKNCKLVGGNVGFKKKAEKSDDDEYATSTRGQGERAWEKAGGEEV